MTAMTQKIWSRLHLHPVSEAKLSTARGLRPAARGHRASALAAWRVASRGLGARTTFMSSFVSFLG